jgi:hypothetical protein
MRFLFVGLFKGQSRFTDAKIDFGIKANIAREMKNISKNVLKRVYLIFWKIFNLVIYAGGGHFENIWLTFDTEKLHFLSSLKLYIVREKAT